LGCGLLTQRGACGRGAEKLDVRPYMRLLERVDQQYLSSQRGDMLVFLSGMNEITTLADELRPYAAQTKRWVVRSPVCELSCGGNNQRECVKAFGQYCLHV
jgi:hypothetical protein